MGTLYLSIGFPRPRGFPLFGCRVARVEKASPVVTAFIFGIYDINQSRRTEANAEPTAALDDLYIHTPCMYQVLGLCSVG